MRDVILSQLAAARAVLALAAEEGASPSMVAAGLASLDGAAALVGAWGNLDDPPPGLPDGDTGVCRHTPEQRISTATHGDPRAWMCRDCGYNGTDTAPQAQIGG